MEIQHTVKDLKGRFFIEENGQLLAEMTYEIPSKSVLLITHTEVDETLKKKGIGRKMVALAVELARETHMEVKSICTFAKAILEKSEKYHDVYKR